MKTVLFVPGFTEHLTSRNYRKTIRAIKKKGYNVVFVPIRWQRTAVDEWVKELEAVYERRKASKTILAGFSFGAVTAFVAASKRNPAGLWLFSLSPAFRDDMQQAKKSYRNSLGKRRVSSFSALDFEELAANISTKTLLFLGEREAKKYPELKRRADIAAKTLRKSRVVMIPETGHDVSSDRYIQAIERSI